MKWYYKLERKFGRYAIPDLMKYIVIMYAVGFVICTFGDDFFYRYLSLDVERILQGQVWRLVTFIIAPPSSSLLFILLSLYFYYLMGNVLERAWGAFRFNLYYLVGVLMHIVAAFVIYFVFHVNFPFSTYYLNMSLFLAFAFIMPDAQVLLMYIIPVKIKWVAYFDMAVLGLTIVGGFLSGVLPPNIVMGLYNMGVNASPVAATAALLSIMNFVIFHATTINYKRLSPKEIKRKADFKRKVKVNPSSAKHKCAVCGRTEKDDESLVFRFCSKCEGDFEYCNEHLYTHKHVVKND